MVKVEADINLNVPGLHFVLPCTEKLTAIDLRTQVFDVVPQEVNHLLHLVGSEVVVLAMTLAGGAESRAVAALRRQCEKKAEKAPRRHLFFRSLFNLLEEIYPVRRHHLQSPKVHAYQSFTVPQGHLSLVISLSSTIVGPEKKVLTTGQMIRPVAIAL